MNWIFSIYSYKTTFHFSLPFSVLQMMAFLYAPFLSLSANGRPWWDGMGKVGKARVSTSQNFSLSVSWACPSSVRLHLLLVVTLLL